MCRVDHVEWKVDEERVSQNWGNWVSSEKASPKNRRINACSVADEENSMEEICFRVPKCHASRCIFAPLPPHRSSMSVVSLDSLVCPSFVHIQERTKVNDLASIKERLNRYRPILTLYNNVPSTVQMKSQCDHKNGRSVAWSLAYPLP